MKGRRLWKTMVIGSFEGDRQQECSSDNSLVQLYTPPWLSH